MAKKGTTNLKNLLEDTLQKRCEHKDIKIQASEPENGLQEGAWCRDCNKEIEQEYDHEKYDDRFA